MRGGTDGRWMCSGLQVSPQATCGEHDVPVPHGCAFRRRAAYGPDQGKAPREAEVLRNHGEAQWHALTRAAPGRDA